jgi:hypothetical protein
MKLVLLDTAEKSAIDAALRTAEGDAAALASIPDGATDEDVGAMITALGEAGRQLLAAVDAVPAASALLEQLAHPAPAPWQPGDDQSKNRKTRPFVPSPFQEDILRALRGKAHTADRLQTKLNVNRKQLYRDGLNPLKEAGLVISGGKRVGGYYRPDAPPLKYAKLLGKGPPPEYATLLAKL